MNSDPSSLWRGRLSAAFAGARVSVEDDSRRHAGHLPAGAPSRGTHASVEVVWDGFEGKPLPERHRMVYRALGIGRDDADLHALQVRARTFAEADRAAAS